jgi:hypothetical protein
MMHVIDLVPAIYRLRLELHSSNISTSYIQVTQSLQCVAVS